MVHYNFDKDLEMGLQAQKEAREKVSKRFPGIILNEDDSTEKEFDFSGTIDATEHSFEVKWDIMASTTGNIAVEFESRNKASGITTTKASYWIYKIRDKFYLIKTEAIKRAIEENKYFREVTGGDQGSNTRLYLFRENIFIALGEEI